MAAESLTETRIAHVTDAHLDLAQPKGAEWLGKRGLSGLSWRLRRHRLHRRDVADALLFDLLAQPHDLVAMSGDVINFGLEREFAAAKPWLERLGPPERVLATPGNHEALAGPWKEAMQRHWATYAAPGRMLCHGSVALIAVSSACVTPPFFASGYVDGEEMARLRSNLNTAREKALVPVVMIHHPPTSVVSRRKGLSNHDQVAAVLAEEGAALVLHGHTHRRDLSWIDAPYGRIPVLGTPSLSMVEDAPSPPGCWRLMIIRCREGLAEVEIHEHGMSANGNIAHRTPFSLRLPILA
ncbi:MAG: metallophosphoesterase [Pseudomonadota bacterium]